MSDVSSDSIFSKEGAVSKNAGGIVSLMVLQRVDVLLRYYEALLFLSKSSGGYDKAYSRCEASVKALFSILSPRIVSLSNKDYKFHKDIFASHLKEKDIDGAVIYLLSYLELDLELTKLDTRAKYDRTNPIKSNKALGYKG